MDKEILENEYLKAIKRAKEQSDVIRGTETAAKAGLPSLAAIAKRRLPKLRENYDETVRLIAELEAVLLPASSSQIDIEEVVANSAAPPPSPSTRKR